MDDEDACFENVFCLWLLQTIYQQSINRPIWDVIRIVNTSPGYSDITIYQCKLEPIPAISTRDYHETA